MKVQKVSFSAYNPVNSNKGDPTIPGRNMDWTDISVSAIIGAPLGVAYAADKFKKLAKQDKRASMFGCGIMGALFGIGLYQTISFAINGIKAIVNKSTDNKNDEKLYPISYGLLATTGALLGGGLEIEGLAKARKSLSNNKGKIIFGALEGLLLACSFYPLVNIIHKNDKK